MSDGVELTQSTALWQTSVREITTIRKPLFYCPDLFGAFYFEGLEIFDGRKWAVCLQATEGLIFDD